MLSDENLEKKIMVVLQSGRLQRFIDFAPDIDIDHDDDLFFLVYFEKSTVFADPHPVDVIFNPDEVTRIRKLFESSEMGAKVFAIGKF
jgi:hypothetical protein